MHSSSISLRSVSTVQTTSENMQNPFPGDPLTLWQPSPRRQKLTSLVVIDKIQALTLVYCELVKLTVQAVYQNVMGTSCTIHVQCSTLKESCWQSTGRYDHMVPQSQQWSR